MTLCVGFSEFLFQSFCIRNELGPGFALECADSACIHFSCFENAPSLKNRLSICPWYEGWVLRAEVSDEHHEPCVFFYRNVVTMPRVACDGFISENFVFYYAMHLICLRHEFFNGCLPYAFGEVDVCEVHDSVLCGVAFVYLDIAQIE